MHYLIQKSEIRPICLPNVSFQTDLNAEPQPQHLWAQLIEVFCLEFKFKSIYRTKILITVLYTKIDPQNTCFNMIRGQ